MSLSDPHSRSEDRSKSRTEVETHKPTLSSAETLAGVDEAVAKCQRGDREGQRNLFELFHRRVYRLATRMVGEKDAPDLTQDVFLRVLQKIDQFRGESRFETWLHRVTVNECLQFLRRQGKRREKPLTNEPAGQSDQTPKPVDQRDLMDRALEQLEPDVRSVFLLREVEGMRYEEIAEATQLSEGTVASRLNRARRQLREILIKLGWEQ